MRGTCEQLMPYLNSTQKVAGNGMEMVVSKEGTKTEDSLF